MWHPGTDLEIDIDPGGLTGTVRADGRSAARNGIFCVTDAEQYADETVMHLELSAVGSTVRARATVADPVGRLQYDADLRHIGRP